MKNLNLLYIFLILLMPAARTAAQGTEGIRYFEGSFAEAKAEAQKQNKTICVEFYANWCPHCQRMFKTVLKDPQVIDLYNKKFLNLKYEEKSKEGRDLMESYGISGYPTFLFLNPATGEVVHQAAGEMPVDKFIKEGETALDPHEQYYPLIYRYNNGERNPEFLYELITAQKGVKQQMKRDAFKAYAAVTEVADFTEDKNFSLLEAYMQDIDEAPFEKIIDERFNFYDALGKPRVDAFVIKVAKNSVYNAATTGDEDKLHRSLILINSVKTPDARATAMRSELLYYLMQEQWDRYFPVAEKLIKKYDANNSDELNREAWIFQDHSSDPKILQIAEAWSKKALTFKRTYGYMETYANVQYKLKNYKEAEKFAVDAIELGKKTNYDYHRMEELLEKIKLASN